jgi:hypothetical protein
MRPGHTFIAEKYEPILAYHVDEYREPTFDTVFVRVPFL